LIWFRFIDFIVTHMGQFCRHICEYAVHNLLLWLQTVFADYNNASTIENLMRRLVQAKKTELEARKHHCTSSMDQFSALVECCSKCWEWNIWSFSF